MSIAFAGSVGIAEPLVPRDNRASRRRRNTVKAHKRRSQAASIASNKAATMSRKAQKSGKTTMETQATSVNIKAKSLRRRFSH